MTASEIFNSIKEKKSFLCVGLDSDISKLPESVLDEKDPIFEFNKRIIDATVEYTVAYKPNLAFYESAGLEGLLSLVKTVDYIRRTYPGVFLIADAKRGDIGNTSGMYARAYFETWDFDAVTVAPYMGHDSVKPFLEYNNRWVILLALTSNAGASDFQYHDENGEKLFETVLRKSLKWGTPDNMMYVVGATKAEMLYPVRKIIPDHFLLIPGVGAQGGSLEEVVRHGINKQCGLLVNSSRGIIFADKSDTFDKTAGKKAMELRDEMASYLEEYNLI